MKREALPDLLVLGHSGFAGGFGTGLLCVGAVMKHCVLVGLPLPRFHLFQQLPTSPNGPCLDAVGHFSEGIIFGLTGIAGQGFGFIRPVFAFINAAAFGERLYSALINNGEPCGFSACR